MKRVLLLKVMISVLFSAHAQVDQKAKDILDGMSENIGLFQRTKPILCTG
jgi:hypothetical protein